jgi:hypothetical protein
MFFGLLGGQRLSITYINFEKRCTPWLKISNEVSNFPNKDRMQKLRPKEVDI